MKMSSNRSKTTLCQERDILSAQPRICSRMAGHTGDHYWVPDTSDKVRRDTRRAVRAANRGSDMTLKGKGWDEANAQVMRLRVLLREWASKAGKFECERDLAVAELNALKTAGRRGIEL